MGNKLRIAVLFRPGRNVEWQRRYTGSEMPDDAIEEASLHRDALLEAGHEAELVQWQAGDPLETVAALRGMRAQLVFNTSSLAEVALLEALGIPYCGSGLDLVALDKAVRKKLWSCHGVNTAPFIAIGKDGATTGHAVPLSSIGPGWTPPPPLAFPLFVKPVRGRGSAGISDDSIVTDAVSLRRQAEAIVSRMDQGALVESYLQGREVTVGVIGDPPQALIPLEIEYNNARTNTFEHKMDNEIMHCPARLSAEQLEAVQDTAMRAFSAVGARDYGRVDTIVGEDGRAAVLEINTFAGLQILTGNERHLHASYIGTMARAMGLSRADVLGRIVDSARRRYAL
ncbi:MAG: D-alanine--D-alanine ligase [Bacillota bacterium]|nr:D-alanine--D-alanine ligase [Bacillota bacterium]